MEEILASIRRIIADDEAKPATAEMPPASAAAAKPEKRTAAAPAARPPVVNDGPPPVVPAAPAPAPTPAAAKAPPPAPPAPRAPAPPAPLPRTPAASNSQDDIDALLNGLDEATTPDEIRPASPDGDVLDLTDEMALPDPPQPAFRKVDPTDDLEFTEAAARMAPRQPAFGLPSAEPLAQQILSRSTVSAVESAFNSLAHTVLSNNARTLEDLVKEMLRPMLKSWLDDNLPGLVERIVKAEIERVSRGR
jgi:cell pole-organizing protein PopZ